MAAKGSQDKHLSENPSITFFKVQHPKHTDFAFHTSRQNFNRSSPGRNMVCEVARSGDLLCDAHLRIELPALGNDAEGNQAYYRDGLAHYIINRIKLEIGNNKIDEIYGSFMDIIEELSSTEGNRQSMMTGYGSIAERTAAAASAQVLHIPLPFYFFQEHCNAIPLVALQYHKVNIVADLKELDESWCEVAPAELPAKADVKCEMFFEYVMLGDDERQKFAKSDIEMLVKQVQYVSKAATVSGGDSIVIDAHFNHPVSNIFWIAEDANKDLEELGKAQLRLNNTQRFDQNNGDDVDCDYFNTVEPYRRYSRKPRKGIYAYSFAAHPERISPSGSLNFSRIDNPQLTLKAKAGMAEKALEVTVYAQSWNVLHIKGGLGGMKWSN